MLTRTDHVITRIVMLLSIVAVTSIGRKVLASRWYIVWTAHLVDATDGAIVHGDAGWEDAAVAWKKEIDIHAAGGAVSVAPFDSYGPYPLHLVGEEE